MRRENLKKSRSRIGNDGAFSAVGLKGWIALDRTSGADRLYRAPPAAPMAAAGADLVR
jgi:hypothetical protein